VLARLVFILAAHVILYAVTWFARANLNSRLHS